MSHKLTLTSSEVQALAGIVARQIEQAFPGKEELLIYAIPRGGIPAAYAIMGKLSIPARMVEEAIAADVIIDDIYDSGATMGKFKTSAVKAVLISKKPFCGSLYGALMDEWVVFPWEGDAVGSAEDIVIRMLQYVGEDVNRPGLKETPARVVKAWGEWFGGYRMLEKDIFKVFEDGAENVDELVIVKDIPFTSHCEHHGAQFHGVAHIGYIPDGKIVGLSKLARLTHMYAKRFQVQERLTVQIADSIVRNLAPLGVGVIVQAEHTCMSTRGIKVHGSSTITSALRGVLKTKPEARAEFMALIK